jgi:hypothetical protein
MSPTLKNTPPGSSRRKRRRRLRRGSATLWLVIWLPCLLVLFCVLVGVANLWLARVELENALEAAALAAVKEWGDQCGGDTCASRNVGVAYAAANTVRGRPLEIHANYAGHDFSSHGTGPFHLATNSHSHNPNQNAQCRLDGDCRGILIFGAIRGDSDCPGDVTFHAGLRPKCQRGRRYGVRAEANIALSPLGGVPFVGRVTQYRVQAKATAEYDCETGRVRLVRVDQFDCES